MVNGLKLFDWANTMGCLFLENADLLTLDRSVDRAVGYLPLSKRELHVGLQT